MQSPLIEKFIVVGMDTSQESFTYDQVVQDQLKPSFLDIFPFESQDSSSYIDNFKLWCFPDGFSIYGENLVKLNNGSKGNRKKQLNQQSPQVSQSGNILSKNALHHFILTNQNSERKYCSGLLIHEEVYLELPQNLPSNSFRGVNNPQQQSEGQATQMKVYVPKMICVVSSSPVLEFQKQFLAFVYKFGITSKMLKQPPRLKVYTQLYERFSRLCEEEGSFQSAESSWEESVYSGTLSELNQLSPSDPLAEQFMLKEEYLISFAVSMIFRAHTFSPGNQKELVFNLSGEEVCRIRPEKADNDCSFFSLGNFSYRSLFERITVPTLISLLTAIMLEKQIIIVASNPNEIINICEALFSLIYPLKWQCLYIPLLPIDLSEMLHALMPYVIGISKQSFVQLEQTLDLKDKVLIDLDQDTVAQTEILKLPEYLRIFLVNNLKELSKQFVKGEQLNQQQQQQQHQQQKKKELWFQIVFSLKRVFLKIMLCLINNFSPYLLYSNEFKRDQAAAQDIFTSNEYLEIFNHEDKPFMNEITRNTMMFNKFIEESYKYLYVTEFLSQEPEEQTEIQFYLRCLKKIQKSMPKASADRKFDILTNSLLFSALELELQAMNDQALMENITQIQNIDLTPHLIKYLKFIESAKPPVISNQSAPNSAKYLTQTKMIFKKLHKDWLMAPPPKSTQLILPKKQNNVQEQISNNSNNHTLKPLTISANTSGIVSELNDTMFQQQSSTRNRIQSNHQINNINNNNNLNSQDVYSLNEESADPSIKSTPILFFRNIFLEYDSYDTRQFQHEFGKQNINFPLNYLTKQYNIFKEPTNSPSVKDPVQMIFMQEQLQMMLQKAIRVTQNNSSNNQNYSNLPLPSRALQPVDTNIGSQTNISGIESNRSSNTQALDTQNSKRQQIFKSTNTYDSKGTSASASSAQKLFFQTQVRKNDQNKNNLIQTQENHQRPPAAPSRRQDQKNQPIQSQQQPRSLNSLSNKSYNTEQDIDQLNIENLERQPEKQNLFSQSEQQIPKRDSSALTRNNPSDFSGDKDPKPSNNRQLLPQKSAPTRKRAIF